MPVAFDQRTFAESYTTAQLKALSASASAAIRVAHCSDCYNTGAFDYGMTGAVVFWSGTTTSGYWLTLSDNVPICSTADADGFTEWCMWLHARSRGEIKTAMATIQTSPLGGSTFAGQIKQTSGSPYIWTPDSNGDSAGGQVEFGTGTSPSACGARRQYNDSSNIFDSSTSIRRKFGLVVTMGVSDTATVANNAFAFSIGIERNDNTTPPLSTNPFTTSSNNSEFSGFIYDPQNVYGFSTSPINTAPGANWAAILRKNGVTSGFPISTGITIASRACFGVTFEPNGTNTARTTAVYQALSGAGQKYISDATGTWTNTALSPAIHLNVPARTSPSARTIRIARATFVTWYDSGTRLVPVAPITPFTSPA